MRTSERLADPCNLGCELRPIEYDTDLAIGGFSNA